jgi:mannobiose 2-epimerase
MAKLDETQKRDLLRLKNELTGELNAILDYWEKFTVDEQHGGFYGSVNNDNAPDALAPKGIVLNSRILWAFSAACQLTKKESHLAMATRAFTYILHHFTDQQHGGVFWSVDFEGKMLDGRKQIYGLAFCIYGLAEYYRVTHEEAVLYQAKQLFEQVELYSLDKKEGGYIEAFARNWKPVLDLRLSEKDDNVKKTMNTHLHIVEAYVNLYSVWPNKFLRERIINLLELFNRYIINKTTHHLNLFMDEDWEVRSSLQSYGHDIEAAWLLQECAEVADDKIYIDHYTKLAATLADAAAEGLDSDGGLWYEYLPEKKELIREKHSWPQAEAMIGFFNAWQLTGDKKYFNYTLNSWEFIKKHIKDSRNGEWFWGVYGDYSVMQKDKAGFWKCPYHNSRACLELIRRIGKQEV